MRMPDETADIFIEHLMDIVQRKGIDGMQKFLDVLEFTYPSVFESITLNIPRQRDNCPGTYGFYF